MKRLIVVLLFSTVAATPSGRLQASANLALHVSPRVAMAPAYIVIRARVERHSANRGLEIVADSPTFFRSSFIQLDGDQAPSVTEVRLRDLPGGQYTVSVALLGADGVRAVVSQPLNIVATQVD